MNTQLLREEIIKAEAGDIEAQCVVVEVLRPKKTDSVNEIQRKIMIFIRLFFLASLKYKDAHYHQSIDRFYAEQIHSYLNFNKPKYKGAMIIGGGR